MLQIERQADLQVQRDRNGKRRRNLEWDREREREGEIQESRELKYIGGMCVRKSKEEIGERGKGGHERKIE